MEESHTKRNCGEKDGVHIFSFPIVGGTVPHLVLAALDHIENSQGGLVSENGYMEKCGASGFRLSQRRRKRYVYGWIQNSQHWQRTR